MGSTSETRAVRVAVSALARVVAQEYRPPRRAKTILRVFLGRTEGLVMLTVAGAPLGWRPFALSPATENIAILSAARTLWAQSKHHGLAAVLLLLVLGLALRPVDLPDWLLKGLAHIGATLVPLSLRGVAYRAAPAAELWRIWPSSALWTRIDRTRVRS